MEGAHRLRTMNLSLQRVAMRVAVIASLFATANLAFAQQESLELDPANSSVKFTLGDVLHTVHGSFHIKNGNLQFDLASGKVTGEIVVDAKSGESGSGMRDRKMHKEVLESERYPEISFRPDQVLGAVASQGKSTVKVHGMFGIHGAEHEITVPVDVEMFDDHWTANVHFSVPYSKWGMKNPSTLFLRVTDTVEIDLSGTGNITHASAPAPDISAK